MNNSSKSLLTVLSGEKKSRPPVWLMRQAGRYLPEYRELRAKKGGFLNLAFDPDRAAEVTIQPIRRYGFDAAILFSDILVTPLALGQDLRFEAGEGPKLGELNLEKLGLEKSDEILSPIYETVANVKSGLRKEGFVDTALIGFAGSPWTVATYMVEGGSSRDFLKTKRMAYHQPEKFGTLIDLLCEVTIQYLQKQINAGAEVVKLFDSWAGVLDEYNFRRWVIAPTKRIVSALKQSHPDIPVIGFPRGAGVLYPEYVRETGIDATALDQMLAKNWAAENIQSLKPVQGNLDPLYLLEGGDNLKRAANETLEAFADRPFVFNLGHGIHKDTPPEHVAQLIKIIREH